jgi:hypothetical protein
MELEHYLMCEELDLEQFKRETTTILGLQQTLNLPCAKTEKETQVRNKKKTIFSYTRIVSKKKMMIMEMLLPYTSH